MARSFLVASMLLAALNDSAQSGAHPASPLVTEFHGFRIGAQKVAESERSSVLNPVFEQLIIVELVGLPRDIFDFFRKIPLVLDPNFASEKPAKYEDVGTYGVAHIRPAPMPNNRPILLHEFSEILAAYREPKNGAFPAGDQSKYFLSNNKEFLAATASIYLFGVIQQPPYNCEVHPKTEHAYMAFLEEQFGPHSYK